MAVKGTKRAAPATEQPPSPPPLKRRIESTTTQKAVAGFFTPVSKKDPEKVTWRLVNDSLLIGKYKPTECVGDGNEKHIKRRKVAAFDFDSTLIRTSSGNVFGKDAADWKWWHSSVPGVLKRLYDEGYIVVIISNQGGINLKSNPVTVKADQRRLLQFKAKVCSVFGQLDFALSIYAATTRDHYRKPRTGMWKEILEDFDLDVGEGPDLEHSIFVGDAGGRGPRNGFKADHSSSDLGFACNVGIQYKTPEEYFFDEAPQPLSHTFDPSQYLEPIRDASTANSLGDELLAQEPQNALPPSPFVKTNHLDVVLFCGSPGAGKSTFYWNCLEPLGYERINQDTLKTRDKCLKVATDCLTVKVSVAVDNTNADPETRKLWVDLAKKIGVPIRCVYFTAPVKLCEHNETVRALNYGTWNPEKRTILPHSAFTGYAARFREPKIKEGFQDIISVPFQFRGNEQERKIWGMYWI